MSDEISEAEWLDIFADNLVDILRDARMSQRDLADAIGVTESTISRYIHKQQIPTLKNIIKDVLSKNTKTNFYDLIDNYNKVIYETEED